ncbi:MAG: DUF2283 domain-containing protein [Firmicutes bacterium]|nr:DUF2283 domain-containing protein [Alicyclobacillaceae bacterium]MCL6497426.1 DUF2283 domain-containing protein [Bacillota bacterium]
MSGEEPFLRDPIASNYDEEADALYLRYRTLPVAFQEEVTPSVIVDRGPAREVVGVEVLAPRRNAADAMRWLRAHRLDVGPLRSWA